MKRKVMSTFNCFMASAELACITFEESKYERFVLTTWTRIKDDALASQLNMSEFVNEHDAKEAYRNFVKSWL